MGIFGKPKQPMEMAHSETCMCDKCTGLGSVRAELAIMRKEVVNDQAYHEYTKAQKVVDERKKNAMDYLRTLMKNRKSAR